MSPNSSAFHHKRSWTKLVLRLGIKYVLKASPPKVNLSVSENGAIIKTATTIVIRIATVFSCSAFFAIEPNHTNGTTSQSLTNYPWKFQKKILKFSTFYRTGKYNFENSAISTRSKIARSIRIFRSIKRIWRIERIRQRIWTTSS